MAPVGPGTSPPLKRTTPQEFYKKTLARVESIQKHLSTTPRTSRLKGKVCILTGVGSLKGIGRASALVYAHEGARHLYLLDYDGTNLPNTQETIAKKFPDVKVTTVQGDAADEGTISDLCKRVLKEEGRLDVFFANAGVASMKPLHNITSEDWEHTMRVNGLSVFLAVKHGSLAMLQPNASRGKEDSGGSIILTASVAGIRSGAGLIDYSASKAAVINIAQTSANQLARTNIRVNSISPGLIETGMTMSTFEAAKARGTAGKIGQLNPLGRYGVAEGACCHTIKRAFTVTNIPMSRSEIAQVALFLASDESSYVNGQNIAVDGGLSSSLPIIPGKYA